jgi:hypothetical protein
VRGLVPQGPVLGEAVPAGPGVNPNSEAPSAGDGAPPSSPPDAG